MDVAEGPANKSRMVSDWQPFAQGGRDPGGDHFSGLAAMVATVSDAGNLVFGQQIDLPARVPLGSRVAAAYIASTGQYFGYFPVANDTVYVADVTNPTGSTNPLNPITAHPAGVSWPGTTTRTCSWGCRTTRSCTWRRSARTAP
jgi:hypothetical protein